MADWKARLAGDDRISAAAISIFAVAWAFLVIKLQSVLVLGLSNALHLTEVLSEAPWEVFATVILFGAIVLPAIVWMIVAKRSMPLGRPVDGGFGFLIGLIGFAVAFGDAALGGTVISHPTPHPVLPFVLGIIAILFQSAVEEVYFRGWIQPLLVRHIGAWGGIAATAIIFGLLHILAGAHEIISILNICLAGGLFGLLAWRTNGLLAPVAAHFAWNWAETVLFGLSPNPGVDVWGAIWDFDISGAVLWSGGGEGMNASLAETFVLIALCLPLALWRRRPADAQSIA